MSPRFKSRSTQSRSTLALLLGVFAGSLALGCAQTAELQPPEQLTTPYPIRAGEVLLAVAPLRNESGTSAIDVLAISDLLVQRVDSIGGITCLPLNRTLAGMRALGMPVVSTPAEAARLARALGADGLIAGTVTAYDPYDPPRFGLALALFGADNKLQGVGVGQSDPLNMQMVATEATSGRGLFRDQPLSVISETLDGRDQGVQMNVRRFAEGRTEPGTALGWRAYLANMDLYTQFATWWSIHRLIQEERMRISRLPNAKTETVTNAEPPVK